MGPHYSQSSRNNATPSSGTSPLASYKEVPPRPGLGRSAILCRLWDWRLETTPASAFGIWYILADILRCPHNEVKNSQRWTLIARQLFTTHRVWYEFNIFLTSDYKKRWWDLYITPSTEYWNCKLKLQVEIESWNWKFVLVVQLACCSISRMLRVQFSRTSNHIKCWEFKLKPETETGMEPEYGIKYQW